MLKRCKTAPPSAFFIPTLLLISALLMCALLIPLMQISAESQAAVSGLEPYAEPQQDVSCIAAEEIALPILAKAIEAQTGKSPYALRVAFGAVIVNRVSSGGFGGSVSAVLSAAGLYPSDAVTPSDRSTRAAKEALRGTDPTLGALYMLPSSDPSVADFESRILVRIADHYFLK